jgi:hypothetical protein
MADDNNTTVQVMDEPKASFIWLKDASGHASVSVTLVAVSFYVTTLAYIVSWFHKIGPLEIKPFDVAACGGYFIPILTMYVTRRFTDAKYGITSPQPSAQSKVNK